MHPSANDLFDYVDASLSEHLEAVVENHLAFCQDCAYFTDGYAMFLLGMENPEPLSPELEAAVARLDARMQALIRGE